jgi:mannitol-specific phosphotransferase system IIBC component
MLRRFLAKDYTVSKRQLGTLLLGIGLIALLVALLSFVGQGPRLVQVSGAMGGVVSALVGLTLLPLGDMPA